ncbi:MAG: YceI family protein, partial [Bacteroidota bacterium]
MKNAILLAISILLLNLTSFAQQNYQLNTKNSKLEWTGKAAFSSYSLSGTINAKSGSLNVADNQIQSAEITINTKSIDASSKQLVQHLKSEDF